MLPQLYPSLKDCQAYLIQPDVALVTRKLLAVRHSGSYERTAVPIGTDDTASRECNIITAAMPGGKRDGPRPGCQDWIYTVRLRIRTVLHVSRLAGFPNIILGAYGCGAFGNPPKEVAQMFVEQLLSPEFRGARQRVVFAIIDPREDGNLKVFRNECARLFPEHRLTNEDLTNNTPTQPIQAPPTHSTERTSLLSTQHNEDKEHGVAGPDDNRDATNEGPRPRARSRDTTEPGHLRGEPVSLTVNDPRWVAPRNATEVADDRILASMRLEARQRRDNGIPYDPVLGPFAPQETNLTPSVGGTSATPAHGLQHIGPDHHNHNTSTAGWTNGLQHFRRDTQVRTRRRTDSTSPQRSDSSSNDERPAIFNITAIFINLAGDTITKMVLNAYDTSLSVGHLYNHTKRHLQLSEKDFSLVSGTHKLDDLTARFFRIRAIQDAVRTSTDHTISLTLIRVQRRADPPAHLHYGAPRQLRFHVQRAPVLDNRRMAALNLMPGQERQEPDLPVYPTTIGRIITTIEMQQDAAAFRLELAAQLRADQGTDNCPRIPQAREPQAQSEPRKKEQSALSAASPLTKSRDAGPCCATKHDITATQAQADNDSGTKRRTVTWWDDEHDGQEEAMNNEERAPHSQLGRRSSASQPAPSAGTSTKASSCALDTVQRIQRPNTTWFKVVGALPMPWFECTHPLCIVDITMRATAGCIQQAIGGPFCQLRVISGATSGWLCQADLASFQVDAQIVLQRNIRTVGGTGHTRPDKGKDMLRDLDDLEHRQTQRKRTKDTDSQCLYDAALAKFKIISSKPPRASKTAMISVTQSRQRSYDTIRTRWNKDHEQPSNQSGNLAADTFARNSAMHGPGCAMSITHTTKVHRQRHTANRHGKQLPHFPHTSSDTHQLKSEGHRPRQSHRQDH